MNRRGFLKFLGGGLVATATMAEAGAFAEFMDWIRRAPAWSFPSGAVIPTVPLYDQISAATLDSIRKSIIFDNFFKDSPFLAAVRAPKGAFYTGGNIIQEPFFYGKVAS